jgi:hypothetical protein
LFFNFPEDSKVDSSSDEDSMEKLINEEINLTTFGRHLKWKQYHSIFRSFNGLWCDDSKPQIPHFIDKFQKHFCLPQEQFMELVQLAWNENGAPWAEKKDCTGQMGHPLELMLLGSLHYLGRGFASISKRPHWFQSLIIVTLFISSLKLAQCFFLIDESAYQKLLKNWLTVCMNLTIRQGFLVYRFIWCNACHSW